MPSKNILFFTCFNSRSIHLESSVMYFKNRGYNVFFLTTCESGQIHKELISRNIVVDVINIEKSNGLIYFYKMIKYLITYSRKNKIQFIYSHLQIPNLISSSARFFINAKVFNVRHNSDVIELSGTFKEKFIEKIINKLSNHIIAISDKVKTQLVENENVNPSKIHRINNGYDFSEYEKLSLGEKEFLNIKAKYSCDLLIVSPGRLITTKRHEITIQGVKTLLLKGHHIKLLILGDGPELESIQKIIIDHDLSKNVFLLGYHENISDYFKAADVVALLSESEASSNIVKEAGYFEKPVIVCENVGDFSDYIENGKSGYLLSKRDPLAQFIECVGSIYIDRSDSVMIGAALRKLVLDEFDIVKIGKQYEELQGKV